MNKMICKTLRPICKSTQTKTAYQIFKLTKSTVFENYILLIIILKKKIGQEEEVITFSS